jgi:phosphonatase-like hydrolase
MADIRLAVLDMAGTTVRDDGEVPRAFSRALMEAGIHVTAAQLVTIRGSSKREAVKRLVPAGPDRNRIANAIYASFRQHLTESYDRHGITPIHGATSVFAWLRGCGIRVALNTGFDRDITNLLITALGWQDGVDAVVCGDDVEHGRPAPDLIFKAMERTRVDNPQQVLNVGDTTLDLQAGSAAGVALNVGVLSGAHDREMLATAPHTHLIDSIADLRSVVLVRGEP